MQGSRCDVVLNDGAPNVGAAWITDSTNQLDLCLASLKFATLFLKKGGSFVTKVFRSENYNSLLWVLHQFFEQVIPTKPKASRDSSAELFIVCLQFKAPTAVDPRMLDSQYVFSDIDDLTRKPLPNEESIETKTAMDYTSYKVSDFLTCENPLDILNAVNELVFDEGALAVAANSHPLTIEEIRILCKDLKTVGLADKKLLLKWRRQLRAALVTNTHEDNNQVADENEVDSDEEIQNALNDLQLKRKRQERSERKRKQKMRTQLIKRLQKNLNAPSANADMLDPEVRFGKMYTPNIPEEDLSHLTYDELVERNIEYLEEQEKDIYVDSDGEIMGPQPKLARYVKIEETEEEKEKEMDKVQKQWFNQPIFDEDSDDDEDEDAETAKKAMKQELEEKKAKEQELRKQIDQQKGQAEKSDDSDNNEYSESSDSEEGEDYKGQSIKDFDVLAYKAAKEILTSKHKKTEMINDSFNRYLHDDGPLPSWFEKDEDQHNRPMMPVTKQDVAEWRAKMRAINEVETKRVIEARARKKKKVLAKLKASEEKAAEIAEKEGLDERSKLRILEQIYAKGMSKLHQKERIVVTQKRDNGKPSIPRGKGKVRIVDPRGKKDLRAEKNAASRPSGVHRKKKSKYIHRRK
ncbi:AdoMet-dependent rRNA methyltransferase spb1 [Tritrichomonas foetus]|uniref:AdoMet-dependent rRNA methyltransferase spb1 n=1 Tax=Tritrichomonas foetus TaxID=1144522 RepID=A0A1J4J8N6_9EUKA|nr:AdoMet-dependent rRNA methyltransferase spb1 [Tritrichomonas foetus]|eukprot:OHS95504.1 AdoMet-dependent rRNA methyltransferase spb1 [Tritrichomonas foetus]